jgi:hypothetical protein
MSGLRQTPIPGPGEFAIRLKTDIDKVTGTCPLCGQADVEKEYEKEETYYIVKSAGGDLIICDDSHWIFGR